MEQDENEERRLLKDLLIELDAVAMNMLKFILDSKPELTHLENYFAHNLNTILENNRVILHSLDNNFTMTAGSCVRNLMENWANLQYALRDPSKKDEYAAKITENALVYARTLERIVQGSGTVEELYALPRWTNSGITQRVEQIGAGQVFQYEILSRYTHVDMWAAINDIIAKKELYWNSILGWGIEAANHTLYLIDQQVTLPPEIKSPLESVHTKVQERIVKA
jgi:hypothetical protein